MPLLGVTLRPRGATAPGEASYDATIRHAPSFDRPVCGVGVASEDIHGKAGRT